MSEYTLGLAAGALLGLIILLILKKTGFEQGVYDERQLLEQGKANKIAYRFTLLGLVVCLVINVNKDIFPFDPTALAMLIVITLSVEIFAVYCIRHDAYFTADQLKSRRRYSLLWVAIILANIVSFAANVKEGLFSADGNLQISLLSNAVMIILFGTILIAGFLHSLGAGEDE